MRTFWFANSDDSLSFREKFILLFMSWSTKKFDKEENTDDLIFFNIVEKQRIPSFRNISSNKKDSQKE